MATQCPGTYYDSLTPHGVSGLKCISGRLAHGSPKSHPTRGEWIEIYLLDTDAFRADSLTPHGVSGLKYAVKRIGLNEVVSHPTRGEWIEIHGVIITDPSVASLTPHGVTLRADGKRQVSSHMEQGKTI